MVVPTHGVYQGRRVNAAGFGATSSLATSSTASVSRSWSRLGIEARQPQRCAPPMSSRSSRGSASSSMRSVRVSQAASTQPARPSFGLKSQDERAKMQLKKRNHKKQGGFNKVLMQPFAFSTSPTAAGGLVVDAMEIAPESPNRSRATKKRKVGVKQQRPSVIEKALTRAASDVSKTLEELGEGHRRLTCKQRIAECLLRLRAAAMLSASIRQLESEHGGGSKTQPKPSIRDLCGDFGMALFSPLDLEAFKPALKDESESHEPEIVLEPPVHYPVQLDPELPYVLKSCPLTLKPDMIRQLMEYLPETVRTMTWKRVFASGRDGDVFINMLNRAHDFDNTIVVCETTRGHILGGFAAVPWGRQSGYGTAFYGNGQSFLFASHPREDCDDEEREPHDDSLSIYKWTGNNDYCQVCDVEEGQIAMGGGGCFGLIVDTNFSRGSTGRCSTFNNPPLVPTIGGTFELVNFEVYGFMSMAERLSLSPKSAAATDPLSKTVRRSLLRMDSPIYDNPFTK
mmetsp:Transcript_45984/g.68441  ORF Transcript_45984/g.68441 Transcript_45984/m.68441 type:complete len:512 (-) Transcript_45984:254-1789(-)|eukprot:CAMPEP_0194056846 /NCGR_PEP_ID=MMETSP0009_2-20130614/61482_1 /TAXON_ID=210454 /ORGANISM="Grammatophora oceanica, Strain CCMP 410" /LENGTH=511 /DNA_ID=CAMNT_0038706369 /DNA_START=64 /DNA_END=1599 /DNA_ORIENTATION=-